MAYCNSRNNLTILCFKNHQVLEPPKATFPTQRAQQLTPPRLSGFLERAVRLAQCLCLHSPVLQAADPHLRAGRRAPEVRPC